VKCFDELQLAVAPFNSIDYNGDWQTFVTMAASPLSVILKSPCLFLKVQFQIYVVFSYL